MVLNKGAAIRCLVAVSGAKATHRRTEQCTPAPRRKGIETTRAASIVVFIGEQVLPTVMQVRIVIGSKAAVAAVPAVVATAAAPAQSQTKQIAIVVRRIGKVLKIQRRFIFKVTIDRNGGRYDHKLTVFTMMILMILVTLTLVVATLIGN